MINLLSTFLIVDGRMIMMKNITFMIKNLEDIFITKIKEKIEAYYIR